MTDSTALAQRFDLAPDTSSVYIWEVAQKPVSVRIPFDLIDRLEHDVVESFRSLSSRGSEIGGLLLGRVSPGNPMVVSVEDCELMPCDYSRGPLYRLGDADLARIERAIEKYTGSRGMQAVGFFRSNTRKGLTLDAEDVSFFEARFHEPYQFSMLIRPSATKVSTAGIFIRENGKLGSESSYLEFPFRSSQLAPSRQGGFGAGDSNGASGGRYAAEGPEPAAAKPPSRAQIVPIASRRESPSPATAATASVTAPPVVEAAPLALPAMPTIKVEPASAPAATNLAHSIPAVNGSAPGAPAAKTAAPAAPPAAVVSPSAPAPEITVPDAPAAIAPAKVEPAEKPMPAPQPEKAGLPEAKSGSKLVGIALGGSAAVIVLVLLFVFPGFLHRGAPAVPHQDISSLSLRVERSGTDILLTWNRDSDVIKNTSRAVLWISDGERRENYDMDMNQLRTGSIVYSPLSADVSFRMEVTRKDQSKTSSESVRVLRTRPSPMPDESVTAASAHPNDAAAKTEASATAQRSAAPTTDDDPKTDAFAGSGAPTRQFDARALVTRLRPASPIDLPEPPSQGTPGGPGAGSASSVDLSAIAISPAAIAPPPLPVQSAPPAAKTASLPVPAPEIKGGGQVRAAEVMSRKDAEYPKLARATGSTGTVELLASIGVDGKVKGVKVTKGPPMLVKAAQDAVSQWIYKPATLNGVAVESEAKISMRFGIDR
jgi:TonB family protein